MKTAFATQWAYRNKATGEFASWWPYRSKGAATSQLYILREVRIVHHEDDTGSWISERSAEEIKAYIAEHYELVEFRLVEGKPEAPNHAT